MRLKDTLSRLSGSVSVAQGGKNGGEDEEGSASVSEIPEGELKEVSIGLWLLNSNITSPSIEDILNYTNKKSFAEAKKIILNEIEKQGLKKFLKI